jgi:hypothetical protein
MKDRPHQCIHWIRAEIINGQGDQLSMEQRPQLLGIPEQGGISDAESEPSAEPVANTESLFSNFLEPQDGHSACPFH